MLDPLPYLYTGLDYSLHFQTSLNFTAAVLQLCTYVDKFLKAQIIYIANFSFRKRQNDIFKYFFNQYTYSVFTKNVVDGAILQSSIKAFSWNCSPQLLIGAVIPKDSFSKRDENIHYLEVGGDCNKLKVNQEWKARDIQVR